MKESLSSLIWFYFSVGGEGGRLEDIGITYGTDAETCSEILVLVTRPFSGDSLLFYLRLFEMLLFLSIYLRLFEMLLFLSINLRLFEMLLFLSIYLLILVLFVSLIAIYL
jgi:hypothetical protein